MKNTIYNVNSDNSCTMNISTQSMKRTELRSLSLSKGRSKRHSKGRKLLTLNSSLLTALTVLLCLLVGGKAWGQSTTLTLYDGETTNSYDYSPYGGLYGWHYQVYLYDASDVDFDGTITAVSFKTSSSYSANSTANYTIYMKDVSSGTTLNASTAFSTYLNGSTTCYSSGTMPALESGWNTTPTFSNSFSHESGNSILVIVKAKGCTSSGGCSKYVYYKSISNHVWYNRADVSDPPAESSTGSLAGYLPAIKFTYTPIASSCPKPTNLTASNISATGATLSWTERGSATNWVLEYGTASDFTGATSVNVSGTPSKVLSGLTSETTYYARVKSNCDGGDESEWITCEFTPSNCHALGTGTNMSSSGTSGGIYTYMNYYAYTQQLYTASELGATAGVVESISLHYGETSTNSLTFEIYLGQTSQTSVPTSWITDANLTKVYGPTSTTFTSANNGWKSIDISSANWEWDGTSNILVAIRRTDKTAPSGTTYPDFYHTNSTSPYMMAYVRDPLYSIVLGSNNVATTNGSLNEQRPEIKFCITPACEKLSAPTFSVTPGLNKNTLSWSNITNNQGYKVQYATNSSFTTGVGTADIAQNATSWVHNGSGGSTYYYRMLTKGDGSTYCAEGDYSGEQHAQMLSCTSLSAPSFSVAQTCANQNTLTWSNITNNQGYQIMYADNSSFTGATTQNIATNTISWVHNGTGGTTYYYKMLTKGNGSTYCSLGDWSSSQSKQMMELTLTISGNTVCSGQSTTLTATPTNLCGSAKYSWSQTSGGGLQGTLANRTDVTITAVPSAGTHTYTCTVTDQNTDATATASITMNSMQGPSVSFSPSTISECSSPVSISADLSGTDCNSFYQWTGESETNAYSDLSVTESGTYYLTVTNRYYQQYDMIEQNGISAIVVVAPTMTTDGIAVPIYNSTIAPNSSSTPANIGDSYIANLQEAIKVNGGNTYSGNRPGFLIPAGAAGGVCQSTASVEVEINSVPTFETLDPPTAVCDGNQLYLTAPNVTNGVAISNGGWEMSSNGTSNWSSFASGTIVSSTDNGKYIRYKANSSCGWGYSNAVRITVKAKPTVTISGGGAICEGAGFTLTATSGHSSYSWEKLTGQSGTASANTYSVSNLTTSSNTYRVTATGTNSCTNTATASVTKKDKPSLTIDGTTPICSGQTLTLTATSGHSSYSWSNGTATAGTQGTGSNIHKYTVSNITTGGTYSVTATGTNGCTNSATKAITVNALPSVSIDGTTPICSGQTLTLTATSGHSSYSWSNGTATAGTQGTGSNIHKYTVSNITTGGTYSVTATGTNGCSNTATKAITVNALPSVSIDGTTPICSGQTLTLTATSGHSSYSWSNGTATAGTQGTDSNIHKYTVSNITTGGTYSVTATGTNGCTNSATKAITVNALPSVSIDGTTPICSGQTLTLTATSGHSNYAWGNGSATAGSQGTDSNKHIYTVASITTGGTYSVTATGTNGCSNTASKDITVSPLPTPTISQANNYTELTCSRTSITLTANGSGGTFAWSGGGTGTTNTVSSAGPYTVTETKNGCSGTSDEYEITSNTEHPTVSITGTNEICLGVSTTLQTTSNANYTYSWSNGITTSDNEVTPSATIEYTVTTTDSRNGCQTTGSRTVTVTTPDIPNASSYDYIWRGATSINWNVASNWYVYNSGYSVASSMPGDAKDYYIGTGDCISGSNSPSLNADATVKNLTIYGRSLSIPENKTLNIKGNVSITNNGTISAHNNSTVVFNGTSAQTLSGEMALGKVTFNNASGVTLDNDVTVNSLATFTSGIVNGNMTFETSASSADASYTSYVNGTVTKKGNGSSFIFPTGNDNVLGSIQASVETGKTVSVQFSHNSAGFSESEMPRWWNSNDNCEDNETRFDHVSNFEFWKVNTTSALSATITVSAETETEHFNSEATTYNIEDIFAAMWQGCWNNVGGGTGSVSVTHDTIIVSGIEIPAVSTRASEPQWLTLGSKSHSTLLPIELVSFTATCDGRSALIEWTTATEKNNDYFSLERSDDAINFTEIARIAGVGNSIEPIDYAYTDYGIHGGDNYYRLVQVDYDGTRTASKIVVANCIEPEVGEPDVQAYPNPFNDELTVVLDNFGNRAATIEVYDMLGKLIYTNKVAAPQNSYETILNLSNLPPAAYTVRVSTNDFVINRNVVKQ